MKKRILSVIVAGVILLTSIGPMIKAKAEPTEVEKNRSQYEQLKQEVRQINEKIEITENEIGDLVAEIAANEAEIEKIGNEIDSTNVEIDQAKEDIKAQEEVLGDRLREVYKSGSEVNFFTILFSSKSFSDLITNITSAKTVIELDNKVVDELNETKDVLDEKVASLEEKSNEVKEKNSEVKNKKTELEAKKESQKAELQNAKEKQEKFDKLYLSESEREVVQGLVSIAKNSASSLSQLQDAISQLRLIRDNQLKSPTVKEEVNDAIEKAKVYVANKKAEADRQLQASNNRGNSNGNSNSGGGKAPVVSGNVQGVLNEAYKHLGKPYVYGATGPNSFDCSGFTSYVYAKLGYSIGRTTYNQINAGREVSYSQLQPGDLVFPHSGHVGIYVGNGMMIHAPHTGDVIKVASVYKFWRARRIIG